MGHNPQGLCSPLIFLEGNMILEVSQPVLIELIKAGGNILTALIPSLVSYYLGRKLIQSKQLKQDLKLALNDIKFLLSVEQLHCREHREREGESKRQMIRNSVKTERGLEWSGKFTLSQIIKKLKN